MLKLAIDTGGTFTDLVLEDEASGERWRWKTLSTPTAARRAVLDGVAGLRRLRPFAMRELGTILVATTVATNAVLERKGAATVLITTRGFRDVLIMGRAKRYDTYNLHLEKPAPLVARRDILEVDERIGAGGEVIRALDEASLEAAIETLEQRPVEAVAVCLLHAYANPSHERAIAERLSRGRRELPVSLSSEVSPKHREYERASTTVANAYVTPLVRRFIRGLEDAFAGEGFAGELYVMQSNGGLLTPALARELPVNIIESGPAAGVLLGAEIGKRSGLERVLTFDMGGTTAKAGAVEGGEPALSSTFEVGGINLRKWSGLPLNISAVDLVEIGAGGGSLAEVHMGLVRVGPRSAGAEPGPACYARGGNRATLTDANLVLGYLVAERFAGGQLALDARAAERAVAEQIAEPLGLSTLEAAWGVHTVANASMERALRSMSIERARDPRDYALVAFGGAGPLHAGRLARALGVRKVIVPEGAGVGSAIGMLAAEPRLSLSLTRIAPVAPTESPRLRAIQAELEERVRTQLGEREVARWIRHAHLRYRGQGYELRVELPEAPIGAAGVEALIERFHLAYREAYGYEQREAPVEATDWSLTAIISSALKRAAPSPAARPGTGACAARQRAYFPELGGPIDCAVYDRASLAGSTAITGPAIIAEAESTTVVLPGDRVSVDAGGHLIMSLREEVAP